MVVVKKSAFSAFPSAQNESEEKRKKKKDTMKKKKEEKEKINNQHNPLTCQSHIFLY